jgi:glycosyltransferase involved in cell wall biosynthesis
MCKNYSKHLVLRNYPSFDEALQQKDDDFGEFEKWLGNRECVYLQGCDSDIRAAFECVASVIEATDLCAVVIGHFDQTIRKKLIDEFGEEISKRIYFTGMIKQLLTPLYIKKCCLSLVYYKNVSPNNWYCEANRLYQNIVNGNPVICGSNPPMKDLVEKYGFGIATKTDGADINEISEAIKQMLQDISIYKQNVGKKKDILRWESQEDTIKSIMEKLLN